MKAVPPQPSEAWLQPRHSDTPRKAWVRGEVHTQNIDGFWSLFKRGLIGSFHQISVKHLQRYLDEFSSRSSNRHEEESFALVIANMVIQARLKYKDLTSGEAGARVGSRDEFEPF